jgi:hypothetical protein
MRIATLVAAAALVAGVVAFKVSADDPEYDPALPPRVTSTVPADRAKGVDPALKEIKVTFDRPMTTGEHWSWIIHRNLGVYPGTKGAAKPRWEDEGRTCVLAVKLVPDTIYAVGVNSFRHTGFRDTAGKIAVPRAWIFKTGKPRKKKKAGEAF